MSIPVIEVCPGTLTEGFSSYSPACLDSLFNGKKVSHVLPFASPQTSEDFTEQLIEHRKRISLSGVQEKLSLRLENDQLRLTALDESGQYVLKPIPHDVKKAAQVPANEHLTMQIARQVYGLDTAENALIFFADGTPAYLTKRFDVQPDGGKRAKEDGATLAGHSREAQGENFKYDGSYETLGLLMQRFVATWQAECEKYFALVVFNFLCSNGDAHLKNFSLLETASGDYVLSPAYDLLNTRLHVNDADFALAQGLFADEFKSASYRNRLHPSQEDFVEFGRRIGVSERRMDELLAPFLANQPLVESLVQRSFLDAPSRRGYLMAYRMRRNYLNG
ncbi:MAG: HipA domain-containing protein [Acidobacteria bacterium]|nr:HipA domain-containing protein [Acidobacteriota bacterium]